jgi:hypothetical protein
MSVNQSDRSLCCGLALFGLRHPRLHTSLPVRGPSEIDEVENELPQSGLHSFQSHVEAFGRRLRV